MKSEFEIAITQLCSDRNLPAQVILEAIESALVSAYKRNFGANQNVQVTLDPRTGQARVFVTKIIVDNVQDDRTEISVAEARSFKADAALADTVQIELTPRNFGRIAAQTAKQVIMQRIREAERDSVYQEYAERAGEVVNGIVRNIDGPSGNVTVSMGKAEAILPRAEQIPGEQYRFGQRLRVYISEVQKTGHGPQIILSRAHRGLLRRLLELEVPEIYSGSVEVKSIAREPGSRSKIAVAALQPGIDPVGSCVGMRGVRIQNIVNELNGEKIDVVAWSADDEVYIANALSPAKVLSVRLSKADKAAQVVVPDRALSLAIGKEGQNARLAAKLTGWRIDIRNETEAAQEVQRLEADAREAAARAEELAQARREAAELLAEAEASLADDQEELALAGVESREVQEPELEAEAQIPEPEPWPVEAIEQEVPMAAEAVEDAAVPQAAAPEITEAGEAAQEAVEELAQEAPEEVIEETVEGEEAQTEPEKVKEIGEEPITAEAEAGRVWQGPEEVDQEQRPQPKKGSSKKDRKRVLELDESSGRLVARKKRKPSRRGQFDEGDDW
jgi:N utilization substance protein A